MAQFRTTQDLVDNVLRNAGEVQDGTSTFEALALEYLNKVHHKIINGSNEFDVEIDEPWEWAKSREPMVVELVPKYDTDTISLTNGADAGVFSTAPSFSVEGWHLRVNARDEVFKVIEHQAGGTAFQLDANYTDSTGGTLGFKMFKIDYDLVPQKIYIDVDNKRIDFEETSATELTATLTEGSFTPAELATEVKTQLDSAGASTYTVTHDAISGKFLIASDRSGGGNIFKLQFDTGTNALTSASMPLGYDVADLADAANHSSVYALGGIVRLVEPFRVYRRTSTGISSSPGSIYGVTSLTMHEDYPISGTIRPQAVVEGIPTAFTIYREKADGRLTVRFNRYPRETAKVEVEHIPVPRDLKNSANSVPLVPRKFIHVLEYGASYYLNIEKEDSKADNFFQLAARELRAMREQYYKSLSRTAQYFGQAIPRRDQTDTWRRRFIYGVPED